MADPTPAKTPAPAQPPAPTATQAERDRQVAVAPLNTIAPDDIGAAAKVFDKWLRGISGDYVTLERLTLVAGSIPIIGNIMALVDVLVDVATMITKLVKGQATEFLDWIGLVINVIGVIPAPPTMGAARMTLRPALHLVKQELRMGVKNLGEALIQVLIGHLSDKIAGEIESFVDGAIGKLDGLLKGCYDLFAQLIDKLIDILQRVVGGKPMFDVPKVAPETQLHNSQHESMWDRMLSAAVRLQKQTANFVAAQALQFLPKEMTALVNRVIKSLTDLKVNFHGKLEAMAREELEMSIKWLLRKMLDAVLKRKKTIAANVPGPKGAQVTHDRPGAGLGAIGTQAPAKGECEPCKNAALARAAAADTGKSINFATGCESFTHTDFTLQASIPIAWSRTYRSHLGAYDQGSLGARWTTPFSTRVDIVRDGRKRALIHHGADGRSHAYPWLDIGQRHRDDVEEVTLERLGATLLQLDFGKPQPGGAIDAWRETYELVDTCPAKAPRQGAQHFRLVACQQRDGAAIGLRYDHVLTTGPNAGEQVLSDVLSKQGDATLAHVGVQPDPLTGRIAALWEIRGGELGRQLAAYTYDDHGDLVQAQDENGAAWRYAYDHHLVTRYTDRTGRGMNLRYDFDAGDDGQGDSTKAKAIHEWADDGSFDTRLEWDKNIRLTYVTDALGHETWVYYDILGYTYRVIHPDLRSNWFFRDDAKNITRHVHADGSVDDYRYDPHGNLVCHVRADDTRVHFEYDPSHRLVAILDADGGVWKRDHDPQGRLEQETDPLGHVTRYAYDQAGRPTRVTDAKGGTKQLAYTPDGQLASYTDCSHQTTTWAYDARGRLVKRTDAAGHATQYRYTSLTDATLRAAHEGALPDNFPGQLGTVLHADGGEEHLSHDAEGRLRWHVDALKRRTSYRYTVSGRIQQRIDAAGHRLSYRWDALGRLTELRNENDQPYHFKYDAVGRLLEEIGFDGQATSFEYDESTGALAQVVNGRVTTHVKFDAMGRLTKRRAAVDGIEQTETFGYTAGGRLAEARNQHARLQWFYNDAGNLVREHHHYQGPFHERKQTAVWHHRHDELNQRVGTTRPDGHTLDWLTYGSGHVHGLVLDGEEVVAFERDALHREVQRTQGNGLEQRRRYDPVGRLLEQQLSAPGKHLAAETGAFETYGGSRLGQPGAILRKYGYDKVGQLVHIEDSRRGRIDYRYDPVNRLLQSSGGQGTEFFAFDPAGNILAQAQPDRPDQRPSQRPKLLDNLVKDYAGTHYRYDERGNMVERLHNRRRSEFGWDAFDRMVLAKTPQGITEFAYDPVGRRLVKRHQARPERLREDDLPAAVQTTYGWDGDTLAFESRSGPAQASGVHYIHEPGSFVPLMQVRTRRAIALKPTTDVKALIAANGGYDIDQDPLWNGELDDDPVPFDRRELVFYQCDHLGTPQELTNADGLIAWEAKYKAWGEARVVISNAARQAGLTNQIRFQGQYLDDETGLHYNRYRYYDPVTGRFFSKDPIGIAGGINLARYASNPIQWIDPLGLSDVALEAAQKEAERLRNAGGYVPTATSAVVDTKTGKIYLGNSGAQPENINAQLASRIPQESQEPWPVNNCAEVDAANKALKDRAFFVDLQIATVRTKTGKPFPACRNCRHTFKFSKVYTGKGK